MDARAELTESALTAIALSGWYSRVLEDESALAAIALSGWYSCVPEDESVSESPYLLSRRIVLLLVMAFHVPFSTPEMNTEGKRCSRRWQ